MDNEHEDQNMQKGNFEQEFLNELENPESVQVESPNKKKIKKWLLLMGVIMAIVLAVVVIVVSVVRMNGGGETSVADGEDEDDFFDAETSMMEVLVAPSLARVTIDGKEYANGQYEIAPGEYKVTVEKDGFEPHEGVVVVVDKHRSYVAVCLQPTVENENYYNVNAEDAQICQMAEEMMESTAWDQNALLDEIFDYTPMHNDNGGYYVDPYFNDKDELIVELTFKDCAQDSVVLRDRAYAWMREQGLNPNSYTFEETWDCED